MRSNLNDIINGINGVLFSEYVVFALLATGLLFTIWTKFGQFRALTHGIAVVRGKYDEKDDPGAINHFQALSAALSATVGLGNIGGVALAVALGGPGAVFWMWIIGFVGMSLKMTEVTQSMLYRNTDDPDNPHGGPMFVVREGFRRWGLGGLGTVIGGVFVITLLISAITGGNMFQAWNVADVTATYFKVPQIVTGVILTVVVGAVIIGGIKRIGSVAGRLVPLMCGLYLLSALYVVFVNAGQVPGLLMDIVRAGLGMEETSPVGAFVGASFGFAAMWGVKRALFSSEAGQGSAPIAHSAAKTDEPVREGVVAGLEPFIDTIVVCTLTALVILSSGAWNRGPEALITDPAQVTFTQSANNPSNWQASSPLPNQILPAAKRVHRVQEGGSGWYDGKTVFMIVRADENEDQQSNLFRVTGTVHPDDNDGWLVEWNSFTSTTPPEPLLTDTEDGQQAVGVYGDYAGATLTAYAFDRVTPGLGMWLVSIASWLFAISTMISWSYYGEQGVIYLFGQKLVFPYKIIYCLLILMTTIAAMPLFGPDQRPLIGTDAELDMWTTLGLGVMLVANIPIMLIFGKQAMKAYHDYFRRFKSGEMEGPHEAPSVTDVVEGHDVE